MSGRYVALVGLSYKPTPQSAEVDAEPGFAVTDLPEALAQHFLDIGAIRPAEECEPTFYEYVEGRQ